MGFYIAHKRIKSKQTKEQAGIVSRRYAGKGLPQILAESKARMEAARRGTSSWIIIPKETSSSK